MYFYNLVLDRWVLQARYGASECVLRKRLQIDHFPVTLFSAFLKIEYRTIHQVAKGWCDLVTVSWGDIQLKKRQFTGSVRPNRLTSLRGEHMRKSNEVTNNKRGTKDWLSLHSTEDGKALLQYPWKKHTEITVMIGFCLWVQSGPFPWCLLHSSNPCISNIPFIKLALFPIKLAWKVILWGPSLALKV